MKPTTKKSINIILNVFGSAPEYVHFIRFVKALEKQHEQKNPQGYAAGEVLNIIDRFAALVAISQRDRPKGFAELTDEQKALWTTN